MVRKIATEIFLVSLVGLVLGLFGPFGTFEMPTALRIAYWIIFGITGYAIFRPLIIVGRWLSETLGISPLIGVGLALLLAALPMTLLVATLLSGFDVRAALRWNGLGLLYFQVWLIGFLTNALFSFVFSKLPEATADAPEAAKPASPAPPQRSPVLEGLPIGFGPILALKGEDHYVRVIGEARETLVLSRMRDAIASLGDDEGLQVHRSWWVARDAIRSVRREGRAAILELSNGTDVPVSRENMAALKASGWVKGI